MLSDYLVGLFVIGTEHYEKLGPIFAKQSRVLEELDEDPIEIMNECYSRAKKYALDAVELDQIEDVSPLETLSLVLSEMLPDDFPDKSLYSAEEVTNYVNLLNGIESKLGGVEGVVRRVWEDDEDLDIGGVRNLYDTFKRALLKAKTGSCAFAICTLT